MCGIADALNTMCAQKQKRKAPTRVEGAGDNVPKIDNIEYVGTFMHPYGKLSRVIQEGQLSALRYARPFFPHTKA